MLLLAVMAGCAGWAALAAWQLATAGTFDAVLPNLRLDGGDVLERLETPAALGLVGLVSWVAGTLLALLLRRPVEALFGATTRMRLHALPETDRPLLRRLILEAPGTFHHSILVGTLAEAAANAIGADGLVAKTAALYHDIGKLAKPEYFSENEVGASRHDHLAPAMSALIIIGHVKEGVEIARESGLPPVIVDIIREHHGTSVVSFFYDKAKRQSDGAPVEEGPFRYPGPRPRTPESAVVMLADSVEAAARSLEKPTPAALQALLRRIFLDRMRERQLDDSGMTFTDLARVEEVFFRMLAGMYHGRVRYPDQKVEAEARARPRRDAAR
jgi:putative nucleotidyltransferase with HDIG domain